LAISSRDKGSDLLPAGLAGHPRINLKSNAAAEFSADLELYINEKLAQFGSKNPWPRETVAEITTDLITQAEGSYLWVSFAIESLKH
jgi:hypothetical protein